MSLPFSDTSPKWLLAPGVELLRRGALRQDERPVPRVLQPGWVNGGEGGGVSLRTTSKVVLSVIPRRVRSLSDSVLTRTPGPWGYLHRLKVPSRAREATEEPGTKGPGRAVPVLPRRLLPPSQRPSTPASALCNRIGIGGGVGWRAMRKGQTPGETAVFLLTPRGTHVHPEPGQTTASFLLASFYPPVEKDGQGKQAGSLRLLFPTCHVS